MSSELKHQEQAANVNRLYMIVMGLAFIVAAIGQLANLENSWALYMLVPVGFFVVQMWTNYQKTGEFSASNTGAVIALIATLGVMTIVLFNLSWGIIAPIGLLAVGVAFVVTRL